MPVIQCDIREGRTEEQKRALAREITRVVHETIDAPLEYIYVLIRETRASTTSRPASTSRTMNRESTSWIDAGSLAWPPA